MGASISLVHCPATGQVPRSVPMRAPMAPRAAAQPPKAQAASPTMRWRVAGATYMPKFLRAKNAPETSKTDSKNGQKSMRNGSEIDVNMMIGSRMTSWNHFWVSWRPSWRSAGGANVFPKVFPRVKSGVPPKRSRASIRVLEEYEPDWKSVDTWELKPHTPGSLLTVGWADYILFYYVRVYIIL